jgi:hypothetical protein
MPLAAVPLAAHFKKINGVNKKRLCSVLVLCMALLIAGCVELDTPTLYGNSFVMVSDS